MNEPELECNIRPEIFEELGMSEEKIQGVSNDTILEIVGLGKWFDDFCALWDINLKVRRGERVVVCGPSGSGKSTMIRCVNRLESFEAGKILINNKEVSDKPADVREIRRKVGMVFQSFNLFPHKTVLDNLMLGPIRNLKVSKQEARETAMLYLDRVHIADQANKYPSHLSGGQQQRVAIARALCMKPEMMLFDEPTSALDPEMISGVLEIMVELAEAGMTMVVVTHEMGFAKQVANTMVFMDHGEIVEVAPPDEFFSNPESERTQLFLSQILSH